MPAIRLEALIAAVIDAIRESGFVGTLISPARSNPRKFAVNGQNGEAFVLTLYIWTLTFGGRQELANEYRIQMTSVNSPLRLAKDGPTILAGYEPGLKMFAGFDLSNHRVFREGSPSVQIDFEALRQAETDGLSFHRKTNEEIAIGIRPDQFLAYVANAPALHQFGAEAKGLDSLSKVVAGTSNAEDIPDLTPARLRLLQEVSRLSRQASFARRVLFAYGNRCAITRSQLKLVDAAHILPVGAPGSTDHVSNGIALSPTYHRAYDNGLIYLGEDLVFRLNPSRLQELETLGLSGGLGRFSAPLGRIFVPPDPSQRPSRRLLKLAKKFRQTP